MQMYRNSTNSINNICQRTNRKRIQIENLGKILKYLYGNLENPKINNLIEEIINIKEEEEAKKNQKTSNQKNKIQSNFGYKQQ